MSRKTSLIGCLVGLVLVAGTGTTGRGDLVIDTYSGWNSTTSFYPFGYDMSDDEEGDLNGVEFVGQTFTVGSELTILENFKFWVQGTVLNPVSFNAHLYAWDSIAKTITGGALFQASGLTANSSSWQEFSFSPVNLELDANGEYIAFLAASSGTSGLVGARDGNTYTGGVAYYMNNPVLWTAEWSVPNTITDLVFQASFGDSDPPAIPEPSSFALLGLGCLCMAIVRRRREQQAV